MLGPQFDRYQMVRSTHWDHRSRYPETTSYDLWAHAPAEATAQHLGERREDVYTKAGEMHVAHKRGASVYYHPTIGTAIDNTEFAGWSPSGDLHHAEATAKADYTGSTFPGSQGRLFGDRHIADDSVVQYLQTTREDRHMAPTMLGVAQNDHWQRTGQMLNPSDDLSKHSERFVEKLRGAGTGAIPADFERFSRNTLDFMPSRDRRLYANSPVGVAGANDLQYTGTQIPREEMNAGRRTARSFLPKRPKKGPTVFQPALFEDESPHFL